MEDPNPFGSFNGDQNIAYPLNHPTLVMADTGKSLVLVSLELGSRASSVLEQIAARKAGEGGPPVVELQATLRNIAADFMRLAPSSSFIARVDQ